MSNIASFGIRRWLGFLVFSALVLLTSAVAYVRIDRHLTEEATSRAIGDLRVEALFLLATFERTAAGIEALLDEAIAAGPPDEAAVGARMQAVHPPVSIIQMGLIGASGMLVASNHENFEPVDLSDREHFRVHLENRVGPDEMYVSVPVLGRVSGRYSIQFTKAVRDSQGAFRGVLVASYDAEEFVEFYERFPAPAGQLIVLAGFDGMIRTRSVAGGKSIFAFDVPHTHLHREIVAHGSREVAFLSPIDWIERVGYAQVSSRYPFYIVVANPVSVIFPNVAPYAIALASIAALLISLALGATLYSLALDMRFENRVFRERLENSRRLAEVARLGSLGELAAGLGHEVSTPANTIALATDNLERLLLAEGVLSEAVAKKLARIRGSSQRIKLLMDAVRAHARLPMRDETCDANDAVASALLLVGQQLRLADVEIVERLAPSVALPYAPRDLESVIINILLNARDAIVATDSVVRRVEIASERRGDRLLLTIEDTGGGIPEAIREKIFQPFFTTKPVGRGTGIGLSTAFQIVTARGGTIEAQSAPAGARLVLNLPVREAETTRAEAEFA